MTLSIHKAYHQLLKSIAEQLPEKDGALLILSLMALHSSMGGRFPPVEEVIPSMQSRFEELSCQDAYESASEFCRKIGEISLSKLMESLNDLLQGNSIWTGLHVMAGALSRREDFELPSDLIEVMFEVLPLPGIGASIYLPWDEAGQLLLYAGSHQLLPYVEAIESSNIAAMQLICYLDNGVPGDSQVRNSDPVKRPSYVKNGEPQRFDACLAMPPVGVKVHRKDIEHDLYDRFQISGNQYHTLAIQHLMWQTQGPIAVVVSHAFLFASGADRQLRELLLRQGSIRAVVGLPGGLLNKTQISLALLLLDTSPEKNVLEEVVMINAEHPDFSENLPRNRKGLKNSDVLVSILNDGTFHPAARRVPVQELLQNDCNLVPSRHVLSEQASRAAELISDMRTMALEEVVTIIRPAPVKEKEGSEGYQVYEIGVADLPDAGYLRTPTKLIRIPKREVEKIVVKREDVLLSIKGANRKVGLVSWDIWDSEYGWVIGQSMCILRCSPHVLPKFLTMFLRSPIGQQLIDQITTGTAIPFVQIKQLRTLKVPVPNLVEQKKIVALFDKQVEVLKEIRQLEDELLELIPDEWVL